MRRACLRGMHPALRGVQTILCISTLLLCAGACAATDAGNAALVQQLGAANFAERQAAESALLELGPDAQAALEEARHDPDPEVAERARHILADIREAIAKRTHLVTDALGKPIHRAALRLVRLQAVDKTRETVRDLTSDAWGYVSLPETETNRAETFRLEFAHPDYGLADVKPERLRREKPIVVPLVARDSEAYARALKGVVVDGEDRPVSGARVKCTSVRTPGEGLIPSYGSEFAVSDAKGQFSMYVVGGERKRDYGELIPPNSRFGVTVYPPDNSGLFPQAGAYYSTQEARIVLPRPNRRHTLAFESPEGGLLDPADAAKRVYLRYSTSGKGGQFAVDSDIIANGGKLLNGFYLARYESTEYEPLEVTDASPDILTFRLPAAVRYTGRVVDGITGDIVPGAFVMGMSSVAHNNLALLTDGDWRALAALPQAPSMDDAAVRKLGDYYGFQAFARTDAEGRFDALGPSGKEVYGIIVFARDRLPYEARVVQLKPDDKGRIQLGDLPLFPAAKVLVRPVFKEGRLSIGHEWDIFPDLQPDWFPDFREADVKDEHEFERLHWLKLNETQPLYVPAGLRMRVRFRTPYDRRWCPRQIKQVIQLDTGEVFDLGELHLDEAAEVSVRVVDPRGRPVEGVPVRCRPLGGDTWWVAHNTDVDGVAWFHVPRGSSGQFRASDLPRESPEAGKPNLIVGFRVTDDGKLEEPCEIRVNDAQIKLWLSHAENE